MAQPPDHTSQDPKVEVHQNVGVNYGEVVGIKNVYPTSPRDKNLDILLNKVKSFWVEGVLLKSLYNEVLIELDMVGKPGEVTNPWETILELPNHTRERIPPGKKIHTVFEEVGRSLLILGTPGSGKTISLLTLTRSLIEKAEQDLRGPVPVVFNLSSWSTERLSLFDWMIHEFSIKYNVPKRFSKKWFEQNRLIILLDGLDEVRADRRTVCVQSINAFLHTSGAPGIAVCSRHNEYANLSEKLHFGGAVHIEALRPEQVQNFIENAGNKLNALGEAINVDKELETLAQTPLMLAVMSLAYQNVEANTIVDGSFLKDKGLKTHLFDVYINRMLNRKGKRSIGYSQAQVKSWLSWLAEKMNEERREIFHMEEMQPDIFLSNRDIWLYTICSRIIGTLFFVLSYGVLASASGWVISNIDQGVIPLKLGFTFKMVESFAFGSSIGLGISLIDAPKLAIKSFSERFDRWPIFIQVGFYTVAFTLIYLIVFDIIFVATVRLTYDATNYPPTHPWLIVSTGLLYGSLWIFRSIFRNKRSDIVITGRTAWSYRGALKIAFIALPIGLGVSIVVQLTGVLSFLTPSFIDVDIRIFSWLFFITIVLLLGGLRSVIEEEVVHPNHGIFLTFRSAIFVASLIGLILSALGIAIGGFKFDLNDFLLALPDLSSGWVYQEQVVWGLFSGLLASIYAFLWYGGQDTIQHYVLRTILYTKGYLPFKLSHFLDYAAELILVRKVGSGYIFIHRMLLEHFANTHEHKPATPSSPTSTTESEST